MRRRLRSAWKGGIDFNNLFGCFWSRMLSVYLYCFPTPSTHRSPLLLEDLTHALFLQTLPWTQWYCVLLSPCFLDSSAHEGHLCYMLYQVKTGQESICWGRQGTQRRSGRPGPFMEVSFLISFVTCTRSLNPPVLLSHLNKCMYVYIWSESPWSRRREWKRLCRMLTSGITLCLVWEEKAAGSEVSEAECSFVLSFPS